MTHFTIKTTDLVYQASRTLARIQEIRQERWSSLVRRRLNSRQKMRSWLPWLKPWTEEDAEKSLRKDYFFFSDPYWEVGRLANSLLKVTANEVQISLKDWETLCSVT